jgi:flagellar basal body rod protein FlgB
MSNDLTTEAIRVALQMNQVRAEFASQNIARASTPGAAALQADFGASQGLLDAAATARGDATGLVMALADAADHAQPHAHAGAAINLDEEVADMTTANLKFQSLTESLSRRFGLMRLAITGRN